MSKYLPEKLYKVVALNSKTEYPVSFNHFLDTNPYTEPFSSYDAALKWINDHGERREVYTIIEIYKMP